MEKDEMSAEKILNSVAKIDTTWKSKAESRKANKEILKNSVKIILQKLKNAKS